MPKLLIQFVKILLVTAFTVLTAIGIQAKELAVGVEDIEYYPLYAKRDGQYAGFAREFLDAFAAQYGHSITYKAMPIKRLYGEFVNGRVDIKFPDNVNWGNDKKMGKKVLYSNGVLEYIDGVMVLPNNLAKDSSQLKKLGTVRGFTPWVYLDQIKSNQIKLTENSDLKGLLKLIKAERIDGVYFNILVAKYYLKHTLFDEKAMVFNSSLPHSRSAYHASSIKHPDVIEQINQFREEEIDLIKSLKLKYEVILPQFDRQSTSGG